MRLTKYFIKKLSAYKDLKIIGSRDIDRRIGIISFTSQGFPIQELGEYMDRHRICIRYGAHCAFPLSEVIGEDTLRVSFGCYNDKSDIDTFLSSLQLFIDQKHNVVISPHLEKIKSTPYGEDIYIVDSARSLIEQVKKLTPSQDDAETVVMAGHFLGIPDAETNSFFPGIKPLLPKHLHNLLREFGMEEFPLYTWDIGCRIVHELKNTGVKARLLILANDTTGINELRLSSVNKSGKTADQYRKELLARFSIDGQTLPDSYAEILDKYNLSVSDILSYEDSILFRETTLRGHFQKFVQANKDFFAGLVDYIADSKKIDIAIRVLDNQDIQACTFDTFQSKTGGKFCIIEIAELCAELFGAPAISSFSTQPKRLINPLVSSNHPSLVMLTPAMCNNAIVRGAELYIKIFQQGAYNKKFSFLNIPFGLNSLSALDHGLEIKKVYST